MKYSKILDELEEVARQARGCGAVAAIVDEGQLDGRHICMDGQELLQFGSCSYLGLELDPRLRAGAIAAVEHYGTQFSSSRVYASCALYRPLEEALSALLRAPVMASPSTSLGHLSVLPALVSEEDAMILDQQVHQSVQVAARLAQAQGASLTVLRHSRMDQLEAQIQRLRERHRHIWYLADGVYSMFGDFAPLSDLARLHDQYEQLHLYIDDSHGMSWCGDHGRGSVLGGGPPLPRMAVALSLCKAFGAGGAAMVLPQEGWVHRARFTGGPMMFSGPIQPPTLGAALVSARLHLDNSILPLQERLRFLMGECDALIRTSGLPVVSAAATPIRYVGIGQQQVTLRMFARLKARGLFTNVALYPAVPANQTGLRFAITCHHQREDLARLVDTLAEELPRALAEAGTSPAEVAEAFHRVRPEALLQL